MKNSLNLSASTPSTSQRLKGTNSYTLLAGDACVSECTAAAGYGISLWVAGYGVAGKAKAGMAHSDCGCTCGCAGKTVRSVENTCHT